MDKWLEMGDVKRAKEPYKSFRVKVEQAKAQARLKAEMGAYKEDAKFWLKNGPGRETPEGPGWAAMIKPLIQEGNKTINLFASPDFLQFMSLLRSVLAPFPEALKALSSALDGNPPQAIPLPPPPEFKVEPITEAPS